MISRVAWCTYINMIKDDLPEASESQLCDAWIRQIHESALLAQLEEAHGNIRALETEHNVDVNIYEGDLEDMRAARDDALEQVDDLKKEVTYHKETRSRVHNERFELKRRNKKLENECRRLEKNQHEAMKSGDDLLKDVEKIREELYTWRKQAREAQARNETLKKDLGLIQAERDVLATRNATAQRLREQASQIDHLQTANDNLMRENQRCNGCIQNMLRKYRQKEDDLADAQKQLKLAGLEVAYIHQVNAGYRVDFEDHPERSAHLDGVLKRKNEAHSQLQSRYDECAKELQKEQVMRRVDEEQASGVRLSLKREIHHQTKTIEHLEESRNGFQKQNSQIREMLTQKLVHDDVLEIMNQEYQLIKADNASLINMVNTREATVEETMGEIAPLKAQIAKLRSQLEVSEFEQGELQAEVNSLTTRKTSVEFNLQTLEIAHEIQAKDLSAAIEAEKQKLQDLIKDGPSQLVQNYLQSQDAEITRLQSKVQAVTECAYNWHNRAVEVTADFDPFCVHANQIADWDIETKAHRLRVAEGRLRVLETRLKELGIWEDIWGEVDPRDRELRETTEALMRA